MGWLIGRVLFIGSMVVGLTLGTTLALSLVFEGALTFNAPSWRILNGIILVVGLLFLLQSTVKTCLSLWLDYTNTNLSVTGLLDGAVVRFLVTAYVLLPQTKPVELLGKLSSSLFSHGVTIQTERQWFTTTSSWGQTLFDGGLVLGFIVNAVLIALALYIALARFLNLDLPTHWTLRRFDLARAEQTRIERDKLRDKVQTIEAESAALRDNLKSTEKEIVTLNMKLAESNDTAKAQKQESIRLGNELERYQLKFKEIADQLPKIEADRNASVQTIYKLNEDLRIAHARIEDLEQQIAHLRLQRSISPSDHADVEDDNPLLTLMAMDRVGATEHVLASETPRPSPHTEKVELPLEQREEQGIADGSVELDARTDDGKDDQTETTVAPTSIALSAVDDNAVIQGELIPDTEQKAVDDIEDDHRAVTMPAVSDVTDAGPLDETTDPINSTTSDSSDTSFSPEDADPKTADEIEPQDADLDHEEQPKENSECETAPVEPAVPDYVRPFAPSAADKTPTARELEGDRFDDMRKMAAEYFKARREHPERFDDLNGTKPLRKEEIILRDCIKRLNKNEATPESQPAQPSQPRAAIWQPFTQTPQTESDFTNLTPWGVEDPDKLIVLSPAHGTHEFEDNKHLHNFVGYLFSLSKNHKSNDDTPKNTILQWRRGQIQDILLNDDPRRHRENFTQMFYTIFERYAELLDDVAYAGFIVDVNGTLYSNMVTAEAKNGDYHVTVFQPEVFRLAAEQIGGAENLKQAIERITGETRPVLNWETADLKEVGHQIDITCQKLFSIVDPGTLYISISHRDQTDHNQIYHIHRIRDRKPGELATISQAEIAERDKLWLNPKTENPKPQTTHYTEPAEQPIPDFETLKKQALEDAAKLKAVNETPPSA